MPCAPYDQPSRSTVAACVGLTTVPAGPITPLSLGVSLRGRAASTPQRESRTRQMNELLRRYRCGSSVRVSHRGDPANLASRNRFVLPGQIEPSYHELTEDVQVGPGLLERLDAALCDPRKGDV
jgi:hypothetical protein